MILNQNLYSGDLKSIPEPILVSGDNDYPPYEFNDTNGKPTGFNVDLFKAIAETMNLKYEIKLDNWTKAKDKLKKKEIHMLLGMYDDPLRREYVDFSTPYIYIHYS